MQQEGLSPRESLMLIDSMINKARNRFSENGFLYLLWGWLIFFCSLGHFMLLQFHWVRQPEIIWASTWLAVIFQVIYLLKQKEKEKVKTYSEAIVNYIWVSFGICMFVMAVILNRHNNWTVFYSLILMMYGVPTFLSGIAMQFLPLKIGGMVCWALAIVASFLSPLYILLLLALAVMVAWIIPGYIMRTRYNKENKK